MAPIPYAELHCHTNFSFLDGASPPDDLVERAVELGLTGLAVTDHDGLYGAVRFVGRGRGAGSIRSSAWRSSCWTRPSRIRTGVVIAPRRRRRRRGRPARADAAPAPRVRA